MSGFEIAGIVLGAFPLAISALERYREIETRLGLFFKIRIEYKKVLDNLLLQQLTFRRHLRQLLLPLVVDDDEIRNLLADPGGPAWKIPAVESLLEKRLQDSFTLYMNCIKGLQQVMEDINSELALETDTIQDRVNTPQASTYAARLTSSVSKEGRAFQRYRLKFSNGGSVRARLFKELEDYNNRLEKLLDSSDKDTRLVQTRTAAKQAVAVDATICKFWMQAQTVWKALSAAWHCHCPQHDAKLLLQHQTSQKFEAQVVFTRLTSSLSEWEIHKTKITVGDDIKAEIMTDTMQESVRTVRPTLETKTGGSIHLKSAMKSKNSITTSVTLLKPPPRITFTSAQITSSSIRPITNLCSALEMLEGSCYGYLSADNSRYYVYTVSQHQIETIASISLADLLKGDVTPQPSRSQRYILSLILASSFLQLFESPWMRTTFKEMDISFLSDPDHPDIFVLDEPHITRHLSVPRAINGTNESPEESTPFPHALDQLGIILLELCFGKSLEEQQYRKRWPAGRNATEKAVYDVMAARDWQCCVNDEAGMDYAEAVGWCLGGNRSTAPEKWRQEMLQKVIQPLQRCRDYLKGPAPGASALECGPKLTMV